MLCPLTTTNEEELHCVSIIDNKKETKLFIFDPKKKTFPNCLYTNDFAELNTAGEELQIGYRLSEINFTILQNSRFGVRIVLRAYV